MNSRTTEDRQKRREQLLRQLSRELPDDLETLSEAAPECCRHGRTTRETPCRRPNWRGCPFSPENDLSRGRTREYG